MPRLPALPGVLAAVMVAGCASSPAKIKDPGSWRSPTSREAVRPAPTDTLVARTIRFDVPVPRKRLVTHFLATELAVFLPGTDALPGVHHTEPLTEAAFPAVGSVRRVCLHDGNTAEEEVLEVDEQHLRYLVTNYTSPEAAPVRYGIGEFVFADHGASTRVTWTYSFALRAERFPGSWGGVGRALFRVSFLDRTYADFMDACRAAVLAWAARLPKEDEA